MFEPWAVLPLVSILAPVAAAVVIAQVSSPAQRSVAAAALASTALAALVVVAHLLHTAEETLSTSMGLAVDAFAAGAMALFAMLAFATVVAAPHRDTSRSSLIRVLLMSSTTMLVYAADNIALLIAAFVGSIFPAVVFGRRSQAQSASRLPLVYLGASAVALAGGFTWVAVDADGAGMSSPSSIQSLQDGRVDGAIGAFALIMLAVFLRKGVFPFHSWVSHAVSEGPLLSTSLFLNGHLGAFLVVRIALPLFPSVAKTALPWLGDFALFTALFAAVVAIAVHRPRQVLALLFLSQSSFVLVGLQSANTEAVTGALIHWVVVSVATTAMVISVRLVEVRVGRPLDGNGHLGMARVAPRLSVFFVIAALALVGMPGTLGFCGEDLLLHGVLETHPYVGVALPLATALNAIHSLRLFSHLFLGRREAVAPHVLDVSGRERLALVGCVLFLIAAGLYPAPIVAAQANTAFHITGWMPH